MCLFQEKRFIKKRYRIKTHLFLKELPTEPTNNHSESSHLASSSACVSLDYTAYYRNESSLVLAKALSQSGISHGACFFFLEQKSRSDWIGAHLTLLFLLVVRVLLLLLLFFGAHTRLFSGLSGDGGRVLPLFGRIFGNAYRFLTDDWMMEESGRQVADDGD